VALKIKMTEKEQDFWMELRFSISRAKIFDAYCDWIEPKTYYLKTPSTKIEGKMGFLMPKMEVFKFKLTIPIQFDYLVEIEWVNLKQFKLDIDNLYILENTLDIHLIEN